MPYIVRFDGMTVGETSFEISHGSGRRAGVFHPSAEGLALMPGITAMVRALLDAGRMLRENGVDTDDPGVDIESTTDAMFTTPEGRRIQEAAKVAARLVLHDSRGEPVEWETLLISDMHDIRALAGDARADSRERSDGQEGDDPIRYFITAKLRGSHRGGGPRFSQRNVDH